MKIALAGLDWDVIDLIETLSMYDIMGLLGPEELNLEEFPYLGSDEDWEAIQKKISDLKIVLSVDIPSIRKKLFHHYRDAVISLKHPDAYVSKRAEIGLGSIVQRGVTILPNVKLGLACKMNVNATIHHDSKIGDFCTIAPGALILGNVSIESGVYIGAGAIIRQRCHIGKGAMIGAGAVVVKDLPPSKTYLGVPAREQQKSPANFFFMGKQD